MTFNLETLIRPNIKALTGYASARDDFKGEAKVFLDANENPFPSDFNRYPDKEINHLYNKLADLKGVAMTELLLGNGSDESIDLILRAFCEPNKSSVLCFSPTYSMYKIWAEVNAVAVKEVPLLPNFEWLPALALDNLDPTTRVIFICSPNNPTGKAVAVENIAKLCSTFKGLVVVDEAYIDFSSVTSALSLLKTHPNLIVIQTLSKAWGLAGVRIGLTMTSKEIVSILNKIKPPYNISSANARAALKRLDKVADYKSEIALILQQKESLTTQLSLLKIVEKIHASDANFLLVRFANSTLVYDYLKSKSIVVRDRSKEEGCQNSLRISIGTSQENIKLMNALKKIEL
ncbi:MAG: histidinol-phosphate transaminase [Flavobacteriaceae bacterium]|nr:histidinol-phosphate transaminase [Flavobacteriaceae bacterium]